jgi:hypothetical protein
LHFQPLRLLKYVCTDCNGSSPEACRALQKEALERVASAKTICNSANSEVQWSKNSKEPVGAFTTMRAGARIAMKSFTPFYSCERADLVVKIAYDSASESVTLAVTARERPSKELNHVCNALRRHGRVASGAA